MPGKIWSRYAVRGSAIECQARYGADMLREGVLSNARQDMEQICCETECYRTPGKIWSRYAARRSAIEGQARYGADML